MPIFEALAVPRSFLSLTQHPTSPDLSSPRAVSRPFEKFSKKSRLGSAPSASRSTLTGLSCCSALRNPALNKNRQSPWYWRALLPTAPLCLNPSESAGLPLLSLIFLVGGICRISGVVCLTWTAVARVWLTDWNGNRTAGEPQLRTVHVSFWAAFNWRPTNGRQSWPAAATSFQTLGAFWALKGWDSRGVFKMSGVSSCGLGEGGLGLGWGGRFLLLWCTAVIVFPHGCAEIKNESMCVLRCDLGVINSTGAEPGAGVSHTHTCTDALRCDQTFNAAAT